MPTYLPFFMEEQGIDSAATRAGLLTISTTGAFFGSVSFPQVHRRLSPRLGATVPVALLVLGFALYASWTGSVPILAAALAVSGFGVGLIIPALFSAALERAPLSGAQSVGFLNVAIFSGSFSTPYILAVPRQEFGISGMLWCVCAAIAIVGLAASAGVGRRAQS